MTDKKQEKSEEEKSKEASRNFFYDLAKDKHLGNVYATYLASNFYGNEGKRVLGEHLYKDSLWKAEGADENGNKYNLAQNELEESRKNGEVGTGTLYEESVMKKAGQQIESSLDKLYIQDMLELTENKNAAGKVKKDYQGKTLEDIQPSREDIMKMQQMKENAKTNEEKGKAALAEQKLQQQMQFYQQIMSQYQKYLVDTKMQEALDKEKKQPGKNLESMLCEEPKKE